MWDPQNYGSNWAAVQRQLFPKPTWCGSPSSRLPIRQCASPPRPSAWLLCLP